MDFKVVNQGLLEFIENGKSPYHVVENIGNMLKTRGFMELSEKESWKIEYGKDYFVTRNGSSIMAFRMPEGAAKGFHIIAAHSDSPTFKVKENPEMAVEERYVKLNTEKYGGMILSTWLDRPLSVAGRVVYKNEDGQAVTSTVDVDKDFLVIPNVAIHMNRDMNKGVEYNPQVDMLPLMSMQAEGGCKGLLMKEISRVLNISEEAILGHDLYLYVRDKGRVIGADEGFILSPKLDDLQSVYAQVEALCSAKPSEYITVAAVFDNEEIGSSTMQGADSTLLSDVLERIGESLSLSKNQYLSMVADSFLISADNAHAVHPNHPEKADPTNRPYLNGGIVIKYHGSQKYTTDAVSTAKMKLLCEKAGVPFQTYHNRSDILGGSTLGNISTSHVSLSSVDVGLPQLAMHSAVETGGGKDTAYAIEVFRAFYQE